MHFKSFTVCEDNDVQFNRQIRSEVHLSEASPSKDLSEFKIPKIKNKIGQIFIEKKGIAKPTILIKKGNNYTRNHRIPRIGKKPIYKCKLCMDGMKR